MGGESGRLRPLFRAVLISILGVLLVLGAVLIGSAIWIRRTFGKISVEQLLLHLPGAGGAEVTGAETGYLTSYILQALVIPLGVLIVALFLLNLLRHRRRSSRSSVDAVNRVRPRWERALPGVLAIAVFAAGSGVFANTVGLAQYVRSMISPLSMADYYVAPGADGGITAAQIGVGEEAEAQPKNLVFIYLESIEDQMANTQLFEQNMLEPVQQVTDGWQTIDDYQEFSGGGWTMAGLVGTSCAVPLRGAGIGENDLNSNEIGAATQSFMPGAVCMGDVLAANGYQNVFLGGADAEFASKGKFFESHGYSDVRDLNTWIEEGETELSDWGLSDRRLMDHAKEEVVRLHESGQPFNLTMLTLDSHEPAHLYDYCEQTTDDVLESVIRCSMEQVAGFIQFMSDMGYLDDTVVVLTGDHPKMVGEAFVSLGALNTVEDRSIFNRIWSPDGVPATREGADQLSMFATTLDLLDLGRKDHRAGVGVSAFVGSSPASIFELKDSQYDELIESASRDLYEALWKSRKPEDSV